jgi:O-antigen ligase
VNDAAVLTPSGYLKLRLQQAEAWVWSVVLGLTSLAAGLLAVAVNSPELFAFAALGVGAIVLVQPRVGLYMVAFSLGIDPAVGVLQPVGQAVLNPVPGLLFTPLEVLSAWTALAWAVNPSANRRLWPNRHVLVPAIAVGVLVLVALERGLANEGNLTIGLWEVRGMLLVIPLLIATSGLIRERAHAVRLVAALAIGLLYLTLESALHYTFVVRTGKVSASLEQAFDHGSAVLVSLVVIGGLIWVLWGENKRQRIVALAIVGVAFVVLLTMRRRAAMITADAGILSVGIVLLLTNWRRFLIITPILAVVAGLYLTFYWNSPNSLGQPARAVKSAIGSDSLSNRDQASDDYRLREKLNVWWGIQASPITGTGFGRPYAKPLPLVDLSSIWPFWDYMPHNTILWLWLKAGVFAFMSMLFLFGTAVMQFVNIARRTTTPLLICIAAFGAASVAVMALFAYVDLGLVNARLMALFGVVLGVIPLLEREVSTEEHAQGAPA